MIRVDRPHTPSISAYVDGCRADCCRPFASERSRRFRARRRKADGASIPCIFCDLPFSTLQGLAQHESAMHRRAS